MIMDERGDGPYTHGGNGGVSGNAVPGWLRLNWELQMVLASHTTIWEFP
jgi:hypothetical protein